MKKNANEDRLLDVREASETLAVKPSTLYQSAYQRRVPTLKLFVACCFATERGVRVCTPVHVAILVEASVTWLDAAVDEAKRAMANRVGLSSTHSNSALRQSGVWDLRVVPDPRDFRAKSLEEAANALICAAVALMRDRR